jgi:hypothetical protein
MDGIGGHQIVGRQGEKPVRKSGRVGEGPLTSNELWDPGNPGEVGTVKA